MDLRFDRVIRLRPFRRDVVSLLSFEEKGVYILYTGNPLALAEDGGKLSDLSIMELYDNERKINEGQLEKLARRSNSAFLPFGDIRSVRARTFTWLSLMHLKSGPIIVIQSEQGAFHLKFLDQVERRATKIAKYLHASSVGLKDMNR